MLRKAPPSFTYVLAGFGVIVASSRAASAQSQAIAARDSAVVAIERSIWENALRGRWERVTGTLQGALTVDDGGIYTWTAANTEALRATGCAVTTYAMRDVHTRAVGTDAVALAYRAEISLKCPKDSPQWRYNYLSVYQRRGSAWALVTTAITPAAAAK